MLAFRQHMSWLSVSGSPDSSSTSARLVASAIGLVMTTTSPCRQVQLQAMPTTESSRSVAHRTWPVLRNGLGACGNTVMPTCRRPALDSCQCPSAAATGAHLLTRLTGLELATGAVMGSLPEDWQ